MLVVGEKEAAAGTVAVRDRVDGDLGALPLAEVIERLTREVESADDPADLDGHGGVGRGWREIRRLRASVAA